MENLEEVAQEHPLEKPDSVSSQEQIWRNFPFKAGLKHL